MEGMGTAQSWRVVLLLHTEQKRLCWLMRRSTCLFNSKRRLFQGCWCHSGCLGSWNRGRQDCPCREQRWHHRGREDSGRGLEETKLVYPTVGPAQLKILSRVLAVPSAAARG